MCACAASYMPQHHTREVLQRNTQQPLDIICCEMLTASSPQPSARSKKSHKRPCPVYRSHPFTTGHALLVSIVTNGSRCFQFCMQQRSTTCRKPSLACKRRRAALR